MDDRDLLRHSRHILLEEIGIEGQQKLLDAAVLAVGCGGLGSAALPYLAAAGVGRLIIADGDTVDETNLQRQTAFTEADIGKNKAEAIKGRLNALNSRTQITAVSNRLNEPLLSALMQQCGVVLDCSDNAPTRLAVNLAAVNTRTPLVSGSAARFEGQLAVYRPDIAGSPCYACLFGNHHADSGSCAVFGVFSPLVGIIGAAQAAETLKILTGAGSSRYGVLHTYHALTGEWRQFGFSRNPQCPVCGESKHSTH